MFDVHFSFPCGEGGSVRPAHVIILAIFFFPISIFLLRIGFCFFLAAFLFGPEWLLNAVF